MKLLTAALAVALSLGASSDALAQAKDWKEIKKPALRPFKIQQPTRVALPNGAVIFLLQDRELPLINGYIVIRGGSSEEPKDKIGLVDLFGETWRTGGTKTRTGDELDDYLEMRAARVETGGDVDSTTISWNSLKGDFDDTFAVVVDLIRSPEFREDKLGIAKSQMNTVIARRNDDPMGIATREAMRLGYGKDSPYARIAEYDTVGAVTRDDLVAWHRKTVHPNNMIVGIVGDFDAKAMEQKLRKALGALPKGPAAAASKFEASPAKPGVYFVQKDDVTQSNIRMVHAGVRKNDPDYYAIQVMNEVFGGGFAARLFSNIRTKKGLAYNVGGGVGSQYDHPGLFTLSMSTKSESTVASVDALLEEIDKMQQEPISAEELRRAKDAILNSFIFQYDSKQKVLNQQLLLEYYGYPKDFLEKYQKAVESVTAEQVAAAAKKHIRKGDIALLVVGKESEFDAPLSKFGPVTTLDITIPDPGASKQTAPAAGSDEGKALMIKAADAMGGAAKLGAIKSYRMLSTLTVKGPMGEMALEADETTVFPDKQRQAMKTPMGEMTMVVTPDSGFMSMGGKMQDLPGSQKKGMLDSIRDSPMWLGSKAGDPAYTFAIAGDAKVGEIDTRVLEISGEGIRVKWCIDPKSGDLLRTIKSTPQGEQTVDFSDFRDVSGIKLPFKGVIKVGGEDSGVFQVKSFELNPQIDDAVFQKPAS
ncbi:MAG: insulinase family protein [Thermoanaerobaculia bacterium]|nr:insulinase family protein [Thermoanaerobaculia bacterium]